MTENGRKLNAAEEKNEGKNSIRHHRKIFAPASRPDRGRPAGMMADGYEVFPQLRAGNMAAVIRRKKNVEVLMKRKRK